MAGVQQIVPGNYVPQAVIGQYRTDIIVSTGTQIIVADNAMLLIL